MATVDRLTFTNGLSKLKGAAFRLVCLGATAVGVLALAALLLTVTWGALGFDAAHPVWILVVLTATGLSTGGVVTYARRDETVKLAAISSTAALIGGAVLGVFAVVFQLIVTPSVWAAYAGGALLPALVTALVIPNRRYRLPATAAVLVGGGVVATVALDTLTELAGAADPWLLYLLTIVVPLAVLVWTRVEPTAGRRRAGLLAGGLVLAGVAVPLLTPAPDPLTPGLVLVFGLALFSPLGVLAWRRFRNGQSNVGLAAPLVIVGGAVVGVVIANATGFAAADPWLDWQFLTSPHSRLPEDAGLYPAVVGSFFIMMVMAAFAFPVSVGAAIYLEEYAPSTGWRGRIVQLIQVNIANLAGVPSVVYGLLGLAIIARGVSLGPFALWPGTGTGVVTTAAFTLGLLIMPITIISAQEAIRAVPDAHRRASYAMGASDWHTLRNVVLPEALPGILTGTILSLGRAIGETAPLIMIGAATTVYSPPTSLNDSVSAMPMQIYAWAGEFIADFRTGVLSAGVLTLLLAMLAINAVAILVRNRYERNQ
ncbi:phosphate ABC transporter permease PtsA [Halobacteriales archaeon QH_10_67_13]|nr:MAG: phosphate ABC transporter permease PtsA [Halobacteriales archaeon QH_10_67_13]